MSFMIWQRGDAARFASSRLVLRAAEVPLLQEANSLRDRLEQLHRDREQIVAAAAATGHAEGFARGRDEGRRAAEDEAAATLLGLAENAAAERERLRNEVGALALQVVRKLIGSFDADAVLVALADTATADILPAQPIALVAHPDRCDAVRARLASAQALRCEVRGDSSCTLDACRLETEHGSVDVALEAQLARLAAAWGMQA
jgi:flagellar biosynthesis/type III secretory pathway protein FliH